MIDRDLEGRGGVRHHSRWLDPWRPEDDWGPIIAAVLFLIILGGLVIYGANNLTRVSDLDDAAAGVTWAASASLRTVNSLRPLLQSPARALSSRHARKHRNFPRRT